MIDLNSAYEAELYFKYLQNPNAVSEEWRRYFQNKYGAQLERFTDGPGLPPIPEKAQPRLSQLTLKELKTTEEDELIPIPSLQERIADNMEISLGVPTATSVRTIPVKALDENRRLINNYLGKLRRGKVSFTHLVTWAIIKALRKFPHFNDTFIRADGRSYRLHRKSINLGFAVDLTRKDGSRMLLVPNLKDVGKIHFDEFVQKYDDLIVRARTGKLSVEELQNTTISITNPGMIGTTMSNPRLMQGQSLILAIGSIDYPTEYKAVRPEVLTTLAISKVVTITNTYDHRIIQGAESAEFLSYIQELLLGGEQFYDSIFAVLHIPFEPIRWESDTTPINQFGRIDEQELIEKSAHVELMINAYRVRGHLLASTNPLGYSSFYYPELNPSHYGFTIWDLDRIFHAEDLWEKNNLPLRDIIERLRDTYCGNIGYEFMHIQDPEKKNWIKHRLELHNGVEFTNTERIAFLKKLIEAEEFENFLHTKYIGHKRFSLEGGESAIVLVDKIFQLAASSKLLSIVVGMAHRGRLNLLVNEIGKPIENILQEFEGDVDPNSFMGSGDVKYHLGAEGVYTSPNGEKIDVILSPNPSHLELVDPVVEGMARAIANNLGDKTHSKVLPVLIHGDAAFAGEGIVAETLNFSQLHGFRTGGTIHIVINNQIGFTTPSTESRSTFYATDIAKMIQVPILHVNGNDPEAVAQAGIFAFEYRQQFQSDVIIDLLCYRKYGHNEADEPTYTQPLLYKKIKSMPPISQLYRRSLIQQGIIREEIAIEFERQYQENLQKAFVRLKSQSIEISHKKSVEFNPFAKFSTNISREDFNKIAKALTQVPVNFHLNPKLDSLIKRRQQIFDNPDGKMDWALAESLAFGSILLDGRDIRFSGQDSRRGTFSQRHSVYIDFETEEEYIPLNHISEKQGKLRIFDSPLSEISILGFEYGYSLVAKNSLVFWEAQFGDFANEAQPIFDQFIASGEKKWNQKTNLTVLLPHGYDGQGPEHSNARLERFLQLCAEDNMFVANLTTPSNYFHILRRQAFVRKPLIIMTPKSMLRHPLALSPTAELFNGGFSEIYDDPSVESPEQIKKIILLSGKVYWELLDAINKRQPSEKDFAIVRIEQLYPLDETQLSKIFSRYSNASKIVWFQEEPQNMGAWGFLFERLISLIPRKAKLHYVGRQPSASTATGSFIQHQREQMELIQKVINF